MGHARYGRLTFDPEFLSATDEHNVTVRFSKAERLLLMRFTRSPGVVLSRDDLLDAVSGPWSDASDRNIDFAVTRLRRKLKDSARTPTYIATRYGEGYVWIAPRVASPSDARGAFLVIGPVRGLKHIGPLVAQARAYAEELRRNLDHRTRKSSRVVLDENCPPADAFGVERPEFAIELNFVRAGGRLDCAMALKAFPTGELIRLSRCVVAHEDSAAEAPDRESVEAQVNDIADAMWEALTTRGTAEADPSAEPLAVRMHSAAMMLSNRQSWMENQRRLAARLEANPNDHQARLMLATTVHSKYVQSGASILLPQNDVRAQDENEIERLVLTSLPHLQDNPISRMAAGKLLYFIDRGHRPLAIEMVEDAFNSSTALATSFAILGQMRMNEGEIETALSLLDQGLELCREDSEFEVYLLVLKSQALLASNRRDELATVLEAFYSRRDGARQFFSIYYTSPTPDEIAPEVQQLVERIDEAHARAMLAWLNYIAARLFRVAEHRENILRGLATLLVRRFGAGVIAAEVRESAPALASALTGEPGPPARAQAAE